MLKAKKRDKALESVYTHLNTSKGIKLSTPGYEGFDPEVGGVTAYRRGAKEYGGNIYNINMRYVPINCTAIY